MMTARRRCGPSPVWDSTRAMSAMMPPSPLLSARRTMATYLIDTTTISAHTTSERMPSTLAGSIGTG